MVIAYLSLGSNMGDRENNLKEALALLQKQDNLEVKKISSFYETEPVGYENQDWFLNAVVEVETTLLPQQLLAVANEVENNLGRVRTIRWGPRTLDMDILFYADRLIVEENLEIPHPRLQERAFVLKPLVEINPCLLHPYYGQTVEEILENLPNHEEVRIYSK